MMHPKSRMALATAAMTLCSSALAAQVTLRIQADAVEPNGISAVPAVSANGRVVVLRSVASNLTDDSGTSSLFAYDIVTGEIEALAPTANGNIFGPSVSADGGIVAFETGANNLAPGLDSSFNDVLWLDRSTGQFRRASQGFGGLQANGGSASPVVSGDGRWIAFTSVANNLVAPMTTGGRTHIYLLDTEKGFVDLATRSPDFTEGDRDSLALEANALSHDGTRMVFTSQAENLADVFAGNVSDVFVRYRDPDTGAISFDMMNRNAAGELGTQSSSRGSISPNGRYVVFRSNAGNLLPRTAGDSRMYVRDLDTDALRVLPLPVGYSTCDRARVADDATVVMQCAPEAGGSTALQVFRVKPGATPELISRSADGDPGDGSSGQSFTMSADASVTAFESNASNLIDDDANGVTDVFVTADEAVFNLIFRDGFE